MTWQTDYAHSEINFTVRHMMIAKVRGRFESFKANIDFDENFPTDTIAEVEIDASSINTLEDQRDGHLRSPDFLNVEEYPTITFKSKQVERIDERHGRLIGDLTIRGVTNKVELDVEYAGQAQSPWGTTSAGFSATTTISRKNWGLNWNQALETGGFLVGDDIRIDIDMELVKQPEAETEAAAW